MTLIETAAALCLVWALIVVVIQAVGLGAIYRHFSHPPPQARSSQRGDDAPLVTIIRPVKGLEPKLYECIASTFHQDYPRHRVSIRLCVEDRADPAFPVLQRLVADFPGRDVQVLVEREDPALQHGDRLGPNPKVRNISRAYREARGDVIWVIDCNVWVAVGVLGRMVDRLMGSGQDATPYKFVHQMPLVVDVDGADFSNGDDEPDAGVLRRVWQRAGGRLDEMFMATSHVKFYCAINVVSIAPCIVGKSNMFRKSHLDLVTAAGDQQHKQHKQHEHRPPGIDYFSHNICEDHLIGDILWRTPIPGFANHAILWGDLALQPMASMSLPAYAARRVRWLRARKYTVLAATLVEPGIESLLCAAYLAFACTSLPGIRDALGLDPSPSWSAMALVWCLALTVWMGADRALFCFLHSGASVESSHETPAFARGSPRPFGEWVLAWLAREVLALPIWTWAVLLGSDVNWRGKLFRVRLDTTVEEIADAPGPGRTTHTPELERGPKLVKDRLD